MSWKPYIDLLCKPPEVKAAGIYGLTDGACWGVFDSATPATFVITPAEAKLLTSCVQDGSPAQSSGCTIGGAKYMFIRYDGVSLYLRKGGATLLATKSVKSLIVLLTKDGANPANVVSHTFVADDLRKKGF